MFTFICVSLGRVIKEVMFRGSYKVKCELQAWTESKIADL
jgi:hypothetical protein